MRRAFLRLLTLSPLIATATSSLAAANKRRIDRRLIGTWRSDKERTVKHWHYAKELEPEKKERFENIFGKFSLHFTNTHIHTEFEGEKQVVPYTVVASDHSSVVIMWHEKERSSLQHIHFDGEGYYVLSGYNVEFYTRVSA